MYKMKKKLLSAILCAALAAASIVSASAADTDNYTSGASYRCKVLGTTEFQNNYAGFYRSSSNPEANLYVQFYKNTTNTDTRELVYEQPLDFADKTLTKKYLSDQNGYRYLISGGGNFANKVYPSKAGGTYEKIKVKLSDFSDYFNDNGTYTKNCDRCGGSHDYNFSDEGNGFSSSLIILSGGIFSLVSPDSSGYVEFYISTKLGEDTVFMTDFFHSVSGHFSLGGGTVGRDFRGLTIGDVDKNGYVSLSDAILIQKSHLGMETFDELSKRNADVNRDGIINLKDTIKVQKYQLGIE